MGRSNLIAINGAVTYLPCTQVKISAKHLVMGADKRCSFVLSARSVQTVAHYVKTLYNCMHFESRGNKRSIAKYDINSDLDFVSKIVQIDIMQ